MDTWVFEGSVWVAVAANGDQPERQCLCREGESVHVEAGKSVVRAIPSDLNATKRFVRAMPPRIVRRRQSYAQLVLSLEPVVYYRMEQPRKREDRLVVFDSAPGKHHGVLHLSDEFQQPYLFGRFGDALCFRETAVGNHAIVPDYPKAAEDRLTVSAWVKATGRPAGAMIVGNWGHPEAGIDLTGQFHLYLCGIDGDLSARVTPRDGSKYMQVREGASRPFPQEIWQHVALVADGHLLHLYRNGDEVAFAPVAGILPQPPMSSLGIGCKTNNAGTEAALGQLPRQYFWQGLIDELALFNKALSAEEIRQLYTGNTLVKHPPDHSEAIESVGPKNISD